MFIKLRIQPFSCICFLAVHKSNRDFFQLLEKDANAWSYYELQQYTQLVFNLNYYWSHTTFPISFDSAFIISHPKPKIFQYKYK